MLSNIVFSLSRSPHLHTWHYEHLLNPWALLPPWQHQIIWWACGVRAGGRHGSVNLLWNKKYCQSECNKTCVILHMYQHNVVTLATLSLHPLPAITSAIHWYTGLYPGGPSCGSGSGVYLMSLYYLSHHLSSSILILNISFVFSWTVWAEC